MKTAENSEMILNIGPTHPLTQGEFKITVKLDGEFIKDVEPTIGFTHRGFEKIAESKTYLQYLSIVDRIDYNSGFIYQEAFCSAVEKASDIDIPERAKYIRVMLSELNRISSHLGWFGKYLNNLGTVLPSCLSFREREKISNIFENICHQRYMYNYHIFGGVKRDLEQSNLDDIEEFISIFPKRVKEYADIVLSNPFFMSRTKGIGIITKNKALNYSITGANLRSTGIGFDVRKKIPYLIYDKLDFTVPSDYAGDCYSRSIIRIREMIEALKIIRQCYEFLSKSKGKFRNEEVDPVNINPQSGITSTFVESPRGLVSCNVFSNGSDKPVRVKWRTPSFYTVNILSEILKNKLYSDIPAILGSLDISIAEADR